MDKAKNILIVDDEKLLCWALNEVLTEAGYKVRIAADAEEAWALFEGGGYEVIITDLRLKGMSGLELLSKVKAKNPDAAVILMTASGSRASAQKALDWGALGVVEKPFDMGEILSLLEGPRLLPDAASRQGSSP